MKPPRKEMRETLQSDEDKVLHDTWFEYSDDTPLPTQDRDELIEAILNLMEEQGDITPEPNEFFTLGDLARELGVDPKVARDKYRKAVKRGDAPESSSSTGWVFELKQKPAITEIIKLRRKS